MPIRKEELVALIKRQEEHDWTHDDEETGTIWIAIDAVQNETEKASEAATSLA